MDYEDDFSYEVDIAEGYDSTAPSYAGKGGGRNTNTSKKQDKGYIYTQKHIRKVEQSMTKRHETAK